MRIPKKGTHKVTFYAKKEKKKKQEPVKVCKATFTVFNYSGEWILNFERVFSKKSILEEKLKGSFFAHLSYWMFVYL